MLNKFFLEYFVYVKEELNNIIKYLKRYFERIYWEDVKRWTLAMVEEFKWLVLIMNFIISDSIGTVISN